MSKPLKVLIVEDNESDAELLLRELRLGGYSVTSERVENTAEFQSALIHHKWDVILSDHSLPRFSSMAALTLLKQSDRDIPFIIISGAMGEEAAVAALKAGAADYLVKGKLARLTSAIERELREAQERKERQRAEKALAESERKYRQIIETSLEGVWVVDEEYKTTFVNARMAEMLGYEVPQMLGRYLTEFMDRDAGLQSMDELEKSKKGIAERFDFGFLRSDGQVLWTWLVTSPVFDEEGHYKGTIALVTDITERKRAEEAVRESEDRFRRMADAAPIIIATTDSQGRVDYVNKAAETLVGMSVEGLQTEQWHSLIHPDDQKWLTTLMDEAIKQQKELSVEYRAKNVQGNYSWFYTIYSPRFTASGQFAGLISCTIDITQRKYAEEALSRSLEKEKLVARMVEFNSQSLNVPEILDFVARELGSFLGVDRCLVIKYQGNIYDVNSLTRLLGSYEKGPHVLKVKEEDIPHLDFSKTYIKKKQNYRQCLNIQNVSQIPPEMAEYCAKYHMQAVLVYDVFYRGTIYGRIVLHHCESPRVWTAEEQELVEVIITHLGDALYQIDLYQKEQSARCSLEESYKLLEVYTRKVERSNMELENFATIASHDLQSPLRKIATFGDMFAQAAGEELNEECRDYLARMKKSIQRMQGLITDLLDLSRINRKGKPFRKTDLDDVVHQAMDDLSEQIQSRNAEIDVHVNCVLDADQEQLQQVLVNLIENGLKFSRQGEAPKLHIEAEPLDEQVCMLKVQDNGIGIQSEYYEKIFEVFSRLHGQEAYPGTGIGLSLVKKIVERHQGEITVESVPDNGSTFLIRLPLRQD